VTLLERLFMNVKEKAMTTKDPCRTITWSGRRSQPTCLGDCSAPMLLSLGTSPRSAAKGREDCAKAGSEGNV
jgi:hypothetical protein